MKKLLMIYWLLLGSAGLALAQSHVVKGKVTDASTGDPLVMVNVQLKGTSTGTRTDASGNFSLTLPSDKGELVFSYLGYQAVTQGVNDNMNVKMEKDNKQLDEVVVIGYGEVKKRDLTGAVVSVKGEELKKVPSTNVMESVQGKLPGVDITKSSGAAGAKINVTVRGNRSIRADNGPLYIVDGVQYENIQDISPNDIQSMEVLKDASSTAIYGSRGANGVIIITTKKGVSGKPRVSVNSYVGSSKVAGYPAMDTGPQYVALKREANHTTGRWNSVADDPLIFNASEVAAIQNNLWTNYADLLIHDGLQQDYQVGVSGGSEKTKVYLSLDYFDEKGLFKLDRLKRYSGRLNIDQIVNSVLKVGMQSQITYYDQNTRPDPLNQANKIVPLNLPYDEKGQLILFPNNGSMINPLADEQPNAYQNNFHITRTFLNAYIELTPLKGLSFRSNFGVTLDNSRNGIYASKNTIGRSTASSSRSQYNTGSKRYISWENVLTYQKTIRDHSFGATAVASLLSDQRDSSFLQGEGQLLPSQLYYALANNVSGIAVRTSYLASKLISFTGRLNYNYKGKYLLSLTGRSDGSSKLAPGNKWAFFPSVAGAWRIGDEAFMHKQHFFSDLKLRASYGIAGNDAVSPYSTASYLSKIPFSYDDTNSALAYGIGNQIGNKNLKWELSATTDIGLDFSILHQRIGFTADYYDTHTKDLLLQRTLPTSSGVGTVVQNIGKTRNRGIEIGINTMNVNTHGFSWTSNITFSKNKEEIVALADANTNDVANGWFIGYPVKVFYDYQKTGIWQSKEADQATKFGYKPGDIKVRDVDNSGVLNTADRIVLGKQVPTWSGGISNTFKYANFDLDVYVFARIGQWINSEYAAKYDPQGLENSANFNYWTPERETNDYPRPNASVSKDGTPFIKTLGYKDGSFVKIRNISLGYSLPSGILKRSHISNLRVYVTGKNLFTFSKVKDYDPERGGDLSNPLTKMYVAGLNVEF
ncbi:SusC/RagA family TonB-linked outer membrane protein [Chitinophaga oryziterrae]|uniref:SusC/RagA family TonB-linked outer membrane protein n=1 Tax=Chitinophaga oryziterrae TaxID=1031224 RepID=A0A6N8JFH0_9BACT|nr:TonB-dependent receptor [Chitinophaga oryziterrae]MVT43937.1 SusC/RagA family TonB-linked outer membrane protein [Chitinophaga oryziterrae]